MRGLIAMLLLFSLSVHCAGRLGVVARWWFNRDVIAKTLCVNRDKPQLHCNGKCHLRKQLLAVEKSEEPQQLDYKQLFHDITLFCSVSTLEMPQAPIVKFLRPAYPPLRIGAYSCARARLDHPPSRG